MEMPSYNPLSRNRYRCSMNGDIVKKARIDGHRRNIMNRDRRIEPVKPVRVTTDVRREIFYETRRVRCDCLASHPVSTYYLDPIRCQCGRTIRLDLHRGY